MHLSKKQKTIKYLIYCFVIIISALLQNVDGLWFDLATARCYFLIPVSVILGIDEDEKTAALLGLFAGLLWDAVSAQHMGLNSIFLMIVCYLSSSLVTFLLRSTFWVKVISSVAAVFLYSVIYWLVGVVFKSSENSLMMFSLYYLPSAIYTSIMSVLLCLVLSPLKRKLGTQEDL